MSVSQCSVCGHIMAVDEGKDQHPCWQTFSGSSLVKVMACCFCWRCFCSSSDSFSWSKTGLHFTLHHTTATTTNWKTNAQIPPPPSKKRNNNNNNNKTKRRRKNSKWAFLFLSFLFSLFTEVILDWSYNYHANKTCHQNYTNNIRNLLKNKTTTYLQSTNKFTKCKWLKPADFQSCHLNNTHNIFSLETSQTVLNYFLYNLNHEC